MTDPTPTPIVFEYPKNAKELPRPQSPLLSWYSSGNLPPGCVISGGVVTSYHTCDNPAP
jgi:hypothetical protein